MYEKGYYNLLHIGPTSSNSHEIIDNIFFLYIKKISHSIKVTKQSSKRPSFILFLNLFLTKFIVENALSTLAIATGRINTNLRSKYIKS
jgi:hypothetical protein